MALSKPYEVKIWTSSHGTDYHHFPSSLSKAFHENKHPLRDSLISFPLVNAVPGRQTREKLVTEVQKDLNDVPADTRRTNIILMGDNDIRCNDYIGACRIERNIGRLIELHRGSRHGLIVCGLLPSPATWKENDFLFHRVSSQLFAQVEIANSKPQGRQIAFLKTIHIFLDSDGLIDVHKYFMPDRVHLNSAGALRLAQHLVDSAIPIIETFQA